MKPRYILLALGVLYTTPLAAQPDIHSLKNIKTLPLFVAKSERYIDFTPQRNYDKYVITIVGDQGFSHQFESEYPSVNISEIDLPYDGTYSYEIQAIKQVAEGIKDTINNGRSEDARGTLNIVDVTNGQFTTQNHSIVVAPNETEAPILKEIKIPPKKASFFSTLTGDKK